MENYNPKDSKKLNIVKIMKVMDWNKPSFIDVSTKGWLTWKHCTQEEVTTIKERTNIDVSLTRSKRLIVPDYIEEK